MARMPKPKTKKPKKKKKVSRKKPMPMNGMNALNPMGGPAPGMMGGGQQRTRSRRRAGMM